MVIKFSILGEKNLEISPDWQYPYVLYSYITMEA